MRSKSRRNGGMRIRISKPGVPGKARSRASPALSAAGEREELRRIWSKQDALRELKRVVNVSIEAARQEIPGSDGQGTEVKFNPSAANAATKAIEAANRLMGYGTDGEDGEGGEGELVVRFEDAEDFTG